METFPISGSIQDYPILNDPHFLTFVNKELTEDLREALSEKVYFEKRCHELEKQLSFHSIYNNLQHPHVGSQHQTIQDKSDHLQPLAYSSSSEQSSKADRYPQFEQTFPIECVGQRSQDTTLISSRTSLAQNIRALNYVDLLERENVRLREQLTLAEEDLGRYREETERMKFRLSQQPESNISTESYQALQNEYDDLNRQYFLVYSAFKRLTSKPTKQSDQHPEHFSSNESAHDKQTIQSLTTAAIFDGCAECWCVKGSGN
ncbi:hypothetical protein BLNAU_1776 [Blattamonas nauphoetae]|uniref:Uncharacterized protein n=1 Tax=Blattamonas nauphoetae TaxID=2049346 RepID=A0ABQ9YHK8_9EUKA|nr:hypothetical protein BLNAU_1776 [Blattamonas nauphoetae]